MIGRFSSSSYQENPSFSMFFPSENDTVFENHNDPYCSYASVDCTLSLGTPSTRLITEDDHHDLHNKHRFTSSTSSNNIPALGWDFIRDGSTKTTTYLSHQPQRTIGRGGDSLLARRCANCDTTSTPLWRNGPRGPKSLCNACGIRFKKEERRASAGKSISGGGSAVAEGVPAEGHSLYNIGGSYYDYNNHYYDSQTTWQHQTMTTQRVPCSYYSPAANDYTFVDDVTDGDSDVTAASFVSWRLNVADQLY